MKVNIDRILSLAAEEFANYGFEGLSMRRLAKRCDTTPAAIYYHFNSKQGLFQEVSNWHFDEVVEQVRASIRGISDDKERFEKFVGAIFEIWNANEDAKNSKLLWTFRELIQSSLNPNSSQGHQYYRVLVHEIAREVLNAYCDSPVSDEQLFSFAALFFGYCSLLAVEYGVIPVGSPRYLEQQARLIELCHNHVQQQAEVVS